MRHLPRFQFRKNMQSIQLIIGSVDGTAAFAGNLLANQLIENGYPVTTPVKTSIKHLTQTDIGLNLIITSTTGQGELPSTLRPLRRALYTKRPVLSHLHYAMTILGDSSYGDDYCLGGLKLDELLTQSQAIKKQETLLIDAEKTNNPEDLIVPWGLLIAQTIPVQSPQNDAIPVCESAA